MSEWFRGLLRRALTKRRVIDVSPVRKVRIREEAPADRFVLIIALMIIFFAGLIALEVVHMVLLGTWNEVVFNGIMLVVGTIVGAVWGRQNG
ncbi:hypothetical protein H8E65_06625 [Candidatus Bathyarchaeota archaeon]|nr:hypothetical protein [Candidatus Bathyarchaeota archaeon]